MDVDRLALRRLSLLQEILSSVLTLQSMASQEYFADRRLQAGFTGVSVATASDVGEFDMPIQKHKKQTKQKDAAKKKVSGGRPGSSKDRGNEGPGGSRGGRGGRGGRGAPPLKA